jgi:pimeloyl-ACP methyl ester carboxylesterase
VPADVRWIIYIAGHHSTLRIPHENDPLLGYNVSVVQEPETSFAEDVTATSRVIEQQGGPTILVGHSYGGAIITEAGNNPKVVGLVYIGAFEPDAGESVMALSKKIPAASSSITATADGFLYLDRARFQADFAAAMNSAFAAGRSA